MAKDRIQTEKTNALRLLDGANITYETRSYQAPEGFQDGVSVAHQVGMDPSLVYKTLVLQGASKSNLVCVIPVACELDLKKAAKHFGEKYVEMIPAKEITPVTGYIKGGCSPVGMKKLYRTAIHQDALQLDQITVSAGRVGLQMSLQTKALAQITRAQFADLV